MNLPNRLTLIRLCSVPAFMAFMIYDNLWSRVVSLIIFIGASITDWYDGVIARRTGTVTVVGTFFDPLVDKMLIAAALVGFVELRELHIPAWMVVLIISREFLITGLRSLAASRGMVMAAEAAGKFKTTSQITAIITILIIMIFNSAWERWPSLIPARTGMWRHLLFVLDRLPYWMVFWVTVLTILSGYLYLQKYGDLLKKEFAVLKTLPPTRKLKK
jgi:CDP-diacylglycerol--glycerol-3-phosphate 3-phosphatidyltransferase